MADLRNLSLRGQGMARSHPTALEARRIPYLVNRGSGYANPDYRWRWGCPVCEFECEDSSRAKCQQQADAHRCGGGWCAIPATHPSQPSTLASRFEVTAEDRDRWNRRREWRRAQTSRRR